MNKTINIIEYICDKNINLLDSQQLTINTTLEFESDSELKEVANNICKTMDDLYEIKELLKKLQPNKEPYEFKEIKENNGTD